MADYDYLLASDGTGDAPIMHVTTNRSVGSTTLAVDVVTKAPAKFIAAVGTLLPSGLLDPATVTNIKGHVNGGALQIDAFEPGSSDVGNTASQVVLIKPTTGWANRVASFLANYSGLGTPQNATIAALTATSVVTTGDATIGGVQTVNGNQIINGTSQVTAGTTTSVDGSGNITPSKQVYTVTALGAAATIQVPSFSVWDGAPVVLRLYGASAYGLTFASGYTNISGLSLPTTTVAGKWTIIGALYNSAVSKWQIVSVTTEA